MENSQSIEYELVKEKAKRDASYEYGKGSVEPIAKGAFSGALSSGIASRIFKPKSRWGELALIAGGTLAGAFGGNAWNNYKLKKAQEGREWLKKHPAPPGNMGSSGMMVKTSSRSEQFRVNSEETPSRKIGLKDVGFDTAVGGGIGATLYGLGSAIKSRGKVFSKVGRGSLGRAALKGGLIFGATSPTADIAAKLYGKAGGDDKDHAALFAAYGAGTGVAEPIATRLAGRYATSQDTAKKLEETVSKASPFTDANEARNLLYGYKSKTKGSEFFKHIRAATKKSIVRNALGGLALGYMVDKLSKRHKKKLKKTASVIISVDEAIKAKEYEARKILEDSSLGKDLAITGGALLGGYGAGKLAGYKHASKLGAAIVGGYGAFKALEHAIARERAKRFLKLPYHGKVYEVKKEHDEQQFPVDKILATYTGMKLIDKGA
jgi:hypothetical protein